MKNCAAFDNKLMAEAEAAGGRRPNLVLAYRQALLLISWYRLRTATWYSFLKKTSVTAIGTVDLTYPELRFSSITRNW